MAPLAVLLLAALAVADATHLVRFGYFSEAQPAVGVACARGWFDIPSLGVEVVCLPQSSGGYAVSRLGAFVGMDCARTGLLSRHVLLRPRAQTTMIST